MHLNSPTLIGTVVGMPILLGIFFIVKRTSLPRRTSSISTETLDSLVQALDHLTVNDNSSEPKPKELALTMLKPTYGPTLHDLKLAANFTPHQRLYLNGDSKSLQDVAADRAKLRSVVDQLSSIKLENNTVEENDGKIDLVIGAFKDLAVDESARGRAKLRSLVESLEKLSMDEDVVIEDY